MHTGDDWYRVYDGNGNIIEEGDTGSLKLDYARQQQYRLDGPDSDDTTEGSSFSQDKEDEDKEDDFKSDSDEEPLERKPKEVESQSKNENGGGEAQPDEGQVQTDGESNDGKAEVEPDEPGDGSLEKSATDSVENYAANTEQDKIEPAKGDQPDKWSDAFIIYTAIMMITAMTLLDGFGDENGARFGSGSAKLGRIADQLPAASAHHGWQGLAAEAYDAQNTGLRELITQMAEADKRIQHLVQDHADQITHTRIALGTSIGFLTVCALVAEALQRLGLLSLSLKYQILVCTPVLITCATMQAVLVEHSQQTASSIREATHRYQRVSAAAGAASSPGNRQHTTVKPTDAGAGRPRNATPRVDPEDRAITSGAKAAGRVAPRPRRRDGAGVHTAVGVGGVGLPLRPVAAGIAAQPARPERPAWARPAAPPTPAAAGEPAPAAARTRGDDHDVEHRDRAGAGGHRGGRAPVNPGPSTGQAEPAGEAEHTRQTGQHPGQHRSAAPDHRAPRHSSVQGTSEAVAPLPGP